jgi:hypothetical protein
MCRSQAQGGRRCNGHGQTSGTVPPASSGNVGVKERTFVPTRGDTERMARELPADRKGWDGTVLNERDRRFFALRESGYDGPIDQDGYPDTTSKHAGTLRYMAEQRGETVNW